MTKAKSGKPLVIVESPTKAKTIARFLGDDYMIEASIGHVRDLPAGADEIPEELKKEKWARLGIDIEHDFKPLYVVSADRKEQIRKLKTLLKGASELYLATDEDREGESISWHLVQLLEPKVQVKRLVFHEITKEAIFHALANPRQIDENMVEAQETRRLVDRLYGYMVSPLLWKKVRPKLSAGRVQSVAVRLVVEREKERIAFRRASYWDLEGSFQKASDAPFKASLQSLKGQRIASGKDFDAATGKLVASDSKPALHLDEAAAKALVTTLTNLPAIVRSLEQKPLTERPSAPFTTSTLQQEAGRKLRFGAQRAMRGAQKLYEQGFITYMRTDSTTLSQEALTAARRLIATKYGEMNVPQSPRTYATKVKNAQEAHEAIRPAGSAFREIEDVRRELGEQSDEARLYELIWQRTVASQMPDARGQRTTLTLDVGEAAFVATGKTIDFPGFRLAYVESGEDYTDAVADMERVLPNVKPGDKLSTREIVALGHTTEPPARLTEASLIKEMEARGIGRPSTYASIIETIQARDYCFKKGTALVPTFTAFAVVNLLDRYLHYLVDYAFTAKMETELDEISTGDKRRLEYLKEFWHGNGKPGLEAKLLEVSSQIDPREVCSLPLGKDSEGTLVEIRVGRYGPFLSRGDKRTSLPDEMLPDELTLEKAIELLEKGAQGPKVLGLDPASGKNIYVKIGRFGPYLQLGDADPKDKKAKKPKMASLLTGMTPETIVLETALQILAMPRTVGTALTKGADDKPGEELPLIATNGRFGPYLQWGKETRSIPAEESPLTITLARALELMAQPKTRGRGGPRAAVAAKREIGAHPKSGAAIKLMDGRYGPYVTDGTTNATIPRDEPSDQLTLQRAVELLEARAARGPAKKRPTRRSKAAAK